MSNKIDLNHNCFDVIRIVCALTVFLGHFITHFNIDNYFLHNVAYFVRGVPVFFFLSGLFISHSLEKYSVKKYLHKRVFRIFPELWVCVILNFAVILVCYGHCTILDTVIYAVSQMTVFQFYTGNWLHGYGVGVPNGALWTITVTIQFYIFILFIYKILKKCNLKIWSATIVISVLLDLILEKTHNLYPMILYKFLNVSIIPFFWIFLCGVFIYTFRDKFVRSLVKYKYLLVIVYIVWKLFVPDSVSSIFSGVRYNVITTLLLIMVVTSIGFSYKCRFKEDISYSFYLYHMVVLNFIHHNIMNSFESTTQAIVFFVISFFIICLLAVISKVFISDKLTKLIEKKFKSKVG